VNDVADVLRIVDTLAAVGVRTWVWGGWAEELRGLASPREHGAVRLLYPGPDFHRVDAFLGADDDGGRDWRRAFELDGIPVFLTLVRRDGDGWYTEFPRGRHRWPDDVFQPTARLPVVSAAALAEYRQAFASAGVRAA
jgi:hypothetical protein